MAKSLFSAAVLSLLAGCASVAPEYSSQGTPRQTRAEAERTHAGKVGQLVSRDGAVDTPAKPLRTPFPDYPQSWRGSGIEGTVVVDFSIQEDGSVSDPYISGSPPSTLAALTLEAILRWKFEPAKKGGKPVRVRATQTFVFKLE